MSKVIFSFVFFCSSLAYAGLMEVSASYSIRQSNIDENNYTKNESWSGSFAWYFLELSAIEFSYTKGLSTQSLKSATDPVQIYFAQFEMFGADLIVTMAKKESFFQPFVRAGAAKLQKEFYRKAADGTITKYGEPVDEIVPSYGVGFKIFLTKAFSIKTSYDRWRSGAKDDEEIWDEAIKAGVSWYF